MDSTILDFTQSELDGNFEFKRIKKGDHLLKATFIGHVPVTLNVSYIDSDIDLGAIVMKEIATELMEVIVKAARAPIKLRGDTIEYDASTFRVPEGSSVEDLLKRLPGIEVDQDGYITSDGHSVNKVTVDSKNFFGDDPKAATKNLPAEGIAKVEIPVARGPEGYGGLPGLILMLEINDGTAVIEASKVTYNTEGEGINLKIPKKIKGKDVTSEVDTDVLDKYFKQCIDGERNPFWQSRY